MDTITTFTGKEVDPFDLRERDVDILDIGHALAMTCRFGGHCRLFYSVAQHSVLVSALCSPELALEALMHDAAEAYLGDIPTPLKGRFAGYRETENKAQGVITRRFGIPASGAPAIKEFDREALRIESAFLLGPAPPAGAVPPFECLLPPAAKAAFLARFLELHGR